MSDDERILQEQAEYYSARAPEYDEWFLREGRFDRGEQDNARWFEETGLVQKWLETRGPLGNVLELACGTGLWTRRLAKLASRLHAVDGSAEMLRLCEKRLAGPSTTALTFEQADLFAWNPPERYDTAFFGFWTSHIPEDKFEAFWRMVAAALRPGGRAFLVDSLFDERSTAKDHVLGEPEQTIRTRRLNNGREYRVVKIFRTPQELSQQLSSWGWTCQFRGSGRYFVYGEARR